MSTEKRFRSGFAKYDEFSDEIIDELTGKHYFDSTKDDYVFSEEIVDLLNEQHETITEQASQIDFLKDENKHMRTVLSENKELKQRNNRQKDTITKQQEQIDNYIDIKAKLNAKIKEYETKAEEYELSACGCGSKHNWIKKIALKEFKEELFGKE